MAGSSSVSRNASLHSRRRAQYVAIQTSLRSKWSVPIRSRRACHLSIAECDSVASGFNDSHPAIDWRRRRVSLCNLRMSLPIGLAMYTLKVRSHQREELIEFTEQV